MLAYAYEHQLEAVEVNECLSTPLEVAADEFTHMTFGGFDTGFGASSVPAIEFEVTTTADAPLAFEMGSHPMQSMFGEGRWNRQPSLMRLMFGGKP